MPENRSAAALVLDTNVVLDWLVFRNASIAAALESALADARWQWHTTPAMLAEFEHVLTYPEIVRWQPDREAITAAWSRWAAVVPARPAPLSLPLRCTDPDDQMFIDLAVQLGGATLLSRDRAVLKLARRARSCGVSIVSPERWSP